MMSTPATSQEGWLGITDPVLRAALIAYDKGREREWGHADAMALALGAAEEEKT